MATYFCSACNEHVEAEVDEAEGHSFCALCGLQLDDLHFEAGPSFVRTGDTAHLAGTIIRDADLSRAGGGMAGRYRDDSQARSIDKGKHWIRNFAHQLQIPEANTYIEQATRMYSLATSNGFTRGRRTNQVAAACLYIVLRQDRRPYMLIDFCHLLSVNVYVLGSTYIRLTERLRLDTHPVLVTAVDPSLFLHRFAGKLALPQGKLAEVVQTAMLLIAQMKRDWMQTGRRPAGVCGAALWLACHIHGVQISRKDVIRVVSIGESTMVHRISELRNTAAGDMTLSEYKEHAKHCLAHQRDLEANRLAHAEGTDAPPTAAEASGACCRHVMSKAQTEFAFGMCQQCYTSYIQASGGIVRGAADPPAYTRNLRRDLKSMSHAAKEEGVRLLMAPAALPAPPSSMSLSCASGALVPVPQDAGAVLASADQVESQKAGEGGARSGDDGAGEPRASRSGSKRQRGECSRAGSDAGSLDAETGAIVPYEGADDGAASDPSGGTPGTKTNGLAKPAKKARKRRKSGVSAALEAEFAVALLANDAVKGIAEHLAAARVDLPAVDVAEARALLQSHADTEGGAAAATPEVTARIAALQANLTSLAAAAEEDAAGERGAPTPADSGAQPSSSAAPELLRMRADQYLHVANGMDLQLTAAYVPPTYDAQQRASALALCEQNAAPPAAALPPPNGGGANDACPADAGDGPAQDRPEAGGSVAANTTEPGAAEAGAAEQAVVLVDTLSDVDDAEIEAYLATEEEATIRKELWTVCNQDWLDKQEAKAAAAAAAAAVQADTETNGRGSKKAKRPNIRFEQGDTAEASVLNMFEAKALGSKVNRDVVRHVFEGTDGGARSDHDAVAHSAASGGAVGGTASHAGSGAEGASTVAPPVAEHTAHLQSIRSKTAQVTAQRAGRHSAALEREAAADAGGMGSLGGLSGLTGETLPVSRRLPKLTRRGGVGGGKKK